MNKIAMSLISAMIIATGCSDYVAEAPKYTVPKDAIGVYIVVDASGSMSDSVKNQNGEMEQKFVIANRSLISLGERLDSYLSSGNKSIAVGILLLKDGKCKLDTSTVLTNGNTDNSVTFFRKWVGNYEGVSGGTPLGSSIILASECLSLMDIKSRHIVVLTDGISNIGPSPEISIIEIKNKNTNNPIDFNFIAFDIEEERFSSLKKLGATVVAASNEKELNEKIDYILREKVLLEKEE